jgi:hypothetical protein
MAGEFEVLGTNAAALFTLKVHRGDGMALLAMNWKNGEPPADFVGFAMEYREPDGDRFFALKNRLGFPGPGGKVDPSRLTTLQSPIQKFRWVHFPRNAELAGPFTYRVTPVFMNASDELSFGEPQVAALELRRETFPGVLNIAFTRGFVASQAFVDRYQSAGDISTLLPTLAAKGLTFVPTHPKADEALAWMGFEARNAILETLDQALADETAKVRVIAYDLNEPGIVSRLEKMGSRLMVIIDDSADHGAADSAESSAATRLRASAGQDNVKRQHMSSLQHNKTIVVDGETVKKVVCGSTNLSWRGFFVQNNNAMILQGDSAVEIFSAAFDAYWNEQDTFRQTPSADLTALDLSGIDAQVAFSPHSQNNALLAKIGSDIATGVTSSLFFSLAFLHETPGAVRDAIEKIAGDNAIFMCGVSDRKVGGLDVQKPDGDVAHVSFSALSKNVPEPFSKEPAAGHGANMHHKFVVIDFDKPSARVYFGSYNFSSPADLKNGENLLLIRDRRVAVSYMIEALRIFDHYLFRVLQADATKARRQLVLARPPRAPGEKPWFDEDFTGARKIRDRELFA